MCLLIIMWSYVIAFSVSQCILWCIGVRKHRFFTRNSCSIFFLLLAQILLHFIAYHLKPIQKTLFFMDFSSLPISIILEGCIYLDLFLLWAFVWRESIFQRTPRERVLFLVIALLILYSFCCKWYRCLESNNLLQCNIII